MTAMRTDAKGASQPVKQSFRGTCGEQDAHNLCCVVLQDSTSMRAFLLIDIMQWLKHCCRSKSL